MLRRPFLKATSLLAVFAVACVTHTCSAIFSASSNVKMIDGKTFEKFKKSGTPMLVKFYSPNCGHCHSFAPEYEKAANALNDLIKVVAVEDTSVVQTEGVKGFPTVKLMAWGNTEDFKQERNATSLIRFAMQHLTKFVEKRAGTSTSSSDKKTTASNLIALNDKDFEKSLQEFSDDVWFVLLHAPWCGHCKAMMPDWKKAATTLKGKVKVAQVDATKNNMIAQHFQLKGFPTVLLFAAGGDRQWKTLPNSAVPYEGERAHDAFVQFALQYAGKAVQVMQLTSQDMFEEVCRKGVCLISFLPHILDSKAKGREESLAIVNDVVKASYSMPVTFLWSEGGEQFDFEESLRLGFGFPAVVAINVEKQKFAVHKGQFQVESLRAFITGLMAGRQVVDPLPKSLPKIKKVSKWDGKDAPLEDATDDEL